jgi:hypothetical protein
MLLPAGCVLNATTISKLDGEWSPVLLLAGYVLSVT